MPHAEQTRSQPEAAIFRPFALISFALASCSNAAPNSNAPAPAPTGVSRADIVDVIYEPGTTDEGVLTLLGAPTVNEPSADAVVTAPADQATLNAPVTFSYRVGASTRYEHRRARRPAGLPEWLTLERSAYAHGAPMNGDAFLLVFSTAADAKVLRIFTQERSYAPSADEWQRLVGQSGSVTLTITHAIFEQGRITEDGGPFAGVPVHFTVAQ